MRTIMAIAAIALLLMAGCSGSKDNGGNSPSSTSGTGDGTGPGGSTGPDLGGSGSGMKWSVQNFTGNFEAFPGAASGATGAIASFSTPDNATEAYFNVTFKSAVPTGTPASEFSVQFHDSTQQGTTGPMGTPRAQGTTTNGVASFRVNQPIAGDWTLSIFSTGAPNQGSFTLAVDSHVAA